MKLLITGASGFFGTNLRNLIQSRAETLPEFEIHVTHRRPGIGAHQPGVISHHLDLLEPDAVAGFIDQLQPSHLAHLAWVGPEHQDRYHTTENQRWAKASGHLFESFRDSGGRRLVHLGSCIEYGNSASGPRIESQPLAPDTNYGEAKAEVSLVVDQLVSGGLSAAVARPFFCYGPHEQAERLVPSLILALANGQSIDLTEGRQRRDYLDVRDVADALLHLILQPEATGPFNIGAGHGVEVRSIAKHLGQLAGRPDLLNFGARPEGADSAEEIVADINRIASATDWKPTITLKDGLKHATSWWLAEQKSGSAG